MKAVRLKNNIVVEIIPDYALPIEKWYGVDFAAQCIEAPDNVEQGMVYDAETELFSEPPEESEQPPVDPPSTTDMAEMLLDLEVRTSLLEMGVK